MSLVPYCPYEMRQGIQAPSTPLHTFRCTSLVPRHAGGYDLAERRTIYPNEAPCADCHRCEFHRDFHQGGRRRKIYWGSLWTSSTLSPSIRSCRLCARSPSPSTAGRRKMQRLDQQASTLTALPKELAIQKHSRVNYGRASSSCEGRIAEKLASSRTNWTDGWYCI
jgi:hypothetical protein